MQQPRLKSLSSPSKLGNPNCEEFLPPSVTFSKGTSKLDKKVFSYYIYFYNLKEVVGCIGGSF